MDKLTESNSVPKNYIRLEGSERHPSNTARFVRPTDPNERFSVTITVRRKPDGEPIPDEDYFLKTPPAARHQLSEDEFISKHGASAEDLKKVTDFAVKNGLKVEETNAARRSIVVSGTADQMSKAFAVRLGTYEHEVHLRGNKPSEETYRGRDGFIHVPTNLADIITGVFGLDNRRVAKRGAASTSVQPKIDYLTVPQLAQLYNFPTGSASGQTIAILSEGGYSQSDLQAYYDQLPDTYKNLYPMPTITSIEVTAAMDAPDGETTQDICIAFSAAPDANISVYFTDYSEDGWVRSLERIIHPDPGDTQCSVISTSFYISNGDDAALLKKEGVSLSFIERVHDVLEDAKAKNITFCVCSGDYGVNGSAYGGKIGDGKQHVAYPASDPLALAIGGTTVANVVGTTFDEFVWNDPIEPHSAYTWGTSGGGISDYFKSLPQYQIGVEVPHSLVDNHVGRGVPDVAANGNYHTGVPGIFLNGKPIIGNGTSASTPLWAGLIAVINAALGHNVGFVNPILYRLGKNVFRDIAPPPGPVDNGNGGVKGYPADVGWDACTGLGSPNGRKLLEALKDWPT
jgi:kumamolisin